MAPSGLREQNEANIVARTARDVERFDLMGISACHSLVFPMRGDRRQSRRIPRSLLPEGL